MAGELMAQSVCEWEETENELFHLMVWVEKARLDSADDVYFWGAWGLKGPSVKWMCEDSVLDCVLNCGIPKQWVLY